MNRIKYTYAFVIVAFLAASYLVIDDIKEHNVREPGVVRFGVSPFQDTLVPTIGKTKGWYAEEGLEVEFSILGWTEVMQKLSGGHIDVAINNICSVILANQNNPELIYWYGVNPFDNGFALMIRPGGPFRTFEEIFLDVPDREEALRKTAAQLKGRTIITTRKTDMEQGAFAAVRRGGLDFWKDVKIIDMEEDLGLASFLNGEGDAYIGGVPQRTKAKKEGAVEMLTGSELGPPPINGFVTTATFATDHPDVLLKLLRVWFKIIGYVNENMNEGGSMIVSQINSNSPGSVTLDDFREFWNNYEHYVSSPTEAEDLILSPQGRNYWRNRWDECNEYYTKVEKKIGSGVDPKAFWMEKAHRIYLDRYGLFEN